MDKATLVMADFATGSKMLGILADGGLRIDVAMWLRAPEYEDWRFALSSPNLDTTEPSAAYGLVHETLEKAGFALEHTPPLVILRTNDPFVRALRRIFGKAKSVKGMRLAGQTIGGRFIEEALVYCVQ